MTDNSIDLLAMIAADSLVLRKATNAITTEGPDVEFGDGARNTIFGLGGDDRISGRGNNDVLHGDAGDDILFGGGGRDRLYGGADDDTLDGGSRADRFWAGDGNDTLRLNGGADRVFYELAAGNQGRDVLVGFTIGTDKILLQDYTPSNGALSLTSTGGNALVTFTETGQQLVLQGISFQTAVDNITSIFEIV